MGEIATAVFWEDALRWSQDHAGWLGALVVVSAVTFVGSLILLPILVVRIPENYFAALEPPPSPWREHHPHVRMVVFVLRNVIGGVLFLAGLSMLLLPGQGLLTLFAALVLLDFRGKRAIELSLVRRPRIRRALDWIRRRAGHPPLIPPPPRHSRRASHP